MIYKATIHWERNNEPFEGNRYSRKHLWQFDGGLKIPASASPSIVPEPYTDPSAVDPEEAFIASISSCHMLWFLSIASKNKYIIAAYRDKAEGVMEKNRNEQLAITKVILHPEVTFEKEVIPDQSAFDTLHHQAHKKCFIANSVNTKIQIEAVLKVK